MRRMDPSLRWDDGGARLSWLNCDPKWIRTLVLMTKASYVYIMASGLNGTLYVGVTSDLIRRVWQHRESAVKGFTWKYGVKNLVWYEVHSEITAAITREKQIKAWKRRWKVALIQRENPLWRDLYPEIASW